VHVLRILAFRLFFCFLSFQIFSHESIVLETLYGSVTITEPVLVELINSQAMQRLKELNQYGVVHFIKTEPIYTRYEHSLGVLFLLRHFGASLDEQVMGLLHDVSHAPFSHAIDYLVGTVLDKYSHQDKIFAWYVENSDILPILQKYDLAWIASMDALSNFTMLKDDLPNLCADRLEYNLYGGYIDYLLSKEDIAEIVDNVTYDNDQWVFNDAHVARKFAQVTVDLSEKRWCAAWECFVSEETAQLLKRSLELGIITRNDLAFAVDAYAWSVINASDDSLVKTGLRRIKEYQSSFKIGQLEDHDLYVRGKFRGVNPMVRTPTGLVLLSAIDPEFKCLYDQTKKVLDQGWYLKYT
jgi:hypothetical protein